MGIIVDLIIILIILGMENIWEKTGIDIQS